MGSFKGTWGERDCSKRFCFHCKNSYGILEEYQVISRKHMLKSESYLVIVLNNNSLRRKLVYVLENILSWKWFLELSINWRIVLATVKKPTKPQQKQTYKKPLPTNNYSSGLSLFVHM